MKTVYDWDTMCEQLCASSFSEGDVLEMGLTEDYDDASFLASQDKEKDDIFVRPHVDLFDMNKRAVEKLGVPWPLQRQLSQVAD